MLVVHYISIRIIFVDLNLADLIFIQTIVIYITFDLNTLIDVKKGLFVLLLKAKILFLNIQLSLK